MKKIRILSVIPNRNDATSFYRSIGPLTELTRRDNINVEVMEPSSVTWAVVAASCDILFLQRPYREEHMVMIDLAKIQGKPVWVDYDDDLFSVPQSNPAHAVYSQDSIRKNIATMIARADVVTVSTEPLKNTLQSAPTGPLAKKCEIIRNALPMHIIPPPKELTNKRNKLFCWRGSATHNEDVELWMTDIIKAASEFSDHTFYFQGEVPWRLKKNATKNMQFAKSIDILEYFQVLGHVQPKAMIVPLANNSFNESKSDIARLEGLWAGALCVGPMMTEWDQSSTFKYDFKQGSLYEQIKKIAEMDDSTLNSLVESGRDEIMKSRVLSYVNDQREALINELMGA